MLLETIINLVDSNVSEFNFSIKQTWLMNKGRKGWVQKSRTAMICYTNKWNEKIFWLDGSGAGLVELGRGSALLRNLNNGRHALP